MMPHEVTPLTTTSPILLRQKRPVGAVSAGSGDIVGRLSSCSTSSQARYGPCRRNHAVASGGMALDGCQEFDVDCESSKTCVACGCHRSFHLPIVESQKAGDNLPAVGKVPPLAPVQLLSPPGGILTSLSPEDSCRENSGIEKPAGEPSGVANYARGRKPCRSRQLRTKASQIWGEYVRPLAARDGINIRFCDSKDVCVAEMQKGGHPTCAAKRLQLKWPERVPFTHPKDFTSKELQAFINIYEAGWQEFRLLPQPQSLVSGPSAASSVILPRIPKRDVDSCKVSTKELRYWLRENDKPVFCVHPKAANQFVNMGKLATMILRKGGKCKFDTASGWDTFVTSHEGMNKPALSPSDRRKCIRTVKRLYNKFIMEFIQDTLKEMGLEDDGDLAMAQCSDGDGNDEDDGDENGHCDATSGAIGGGHGGVYLGTNDLNSDTIHQSLGTLGSLV